MGLVSSVGSSNTIIPKVPDTSKQEDAAKVTPKLPAVSKQEDAAKAANQLALKNQPKDEFEGGEQGYKKEIEEYNTQIGNAEDEIKRIENEIKNLKNDGMLENMLGWTPWVETKVEKETKLNNEKATQEGIRDKALGDRTNAVNEAQKFWGEDPDYQRAANTFRYYYDLTDTASGTGEKDGIVNEKDLEAMAKNPDIPEEVRKDFKFLLDSGAFLAMSGGDRYISEDDPTVSISGNSDIDGFLRTAYREQKYHEGTSEGDASGSNNHTKYGDWYYNGKVSGDNYPWCATFVSWCAKEAGIGGTTVPKYEGCLGGIDEYKKAGCYHTAESGYEPKAGDVFFHETAHTGIILAYDKKNNCAYTIEGNCDNEVKIVKRPMEYFTSFGSNGGTSNGVIPSNYDQTKGGIA